MPTYEYKCKACGHLEEVFAKMSDPPPAACESCGAAELEKVLFPVAVHYKGSGFYQTDYASKKPAKSSDSSGDSSPSSSDSGSSSGTSEGSTSTPPTPPSSGSSDA